jgi:ParB-like chromosome segregation protein Spo0J
VNRRQDFDGNFNPIGEHVRERWQKIYLALSAGQVLPPLQLYKLGSDYFVVDGHHRVSVARQLGIQYLEAEVVEYMLSAA